MMPQREAGVDLQQVEPTVGAAFEVELRDAPQLQPPHHRAAQRRHLGRVGDLERGAVAELPGPGPDLSAGKLAHDLSLLAHVDVVALNVRFRAGHQLLSEHGHICRHDARPQLLQRLEALDQHSLARTAERGPAVRAAGERLDHDRERDVELRRGREPGEVELPRHGHGHGQVQPPRQGLESALVDQVFHHRGVADREPERRPQSLAVAGDEQQVAVLLVEQHRRLGLPRREPHQRVDLLVGVLPRVDPGECGAGEAREAGRGPGAGHDHAGNPCQAQRPQQVHVAHDAGERSGVAHARSPLGRGWVSARAADPPPGRLRPGWGAAPWTSAGPGGRGCPAASGSPFRPGRAPR